MKTIHEYLSSSTVAILVAVGAGIAVYGIWVPYSYWWDELYSVVASTSSCRGMFTDWILPDVHPPLYQVLLKIWISIVDDSEPATRSLSLLFSIASLSVLILWGKSNLNKLAFGFCLVMFSTNHLFTYYAQEARSFTMVLFLSTVLTVVFIDVIGRNPEDKNGKFIALSVAAVLLALTHYFGLVYSELILMISLILYRKDLKRSIGFVFTGIVCLGWPIVHYVYGGIGAKTGGASWIESRGVHTTLSRLSYAMLPQVQGGISELFSVRSEYLDAIVIVVLGAIFLVVTRGENKVVAENASRSLPTLAICLCLVLFVAAIVLIDLHTPISTIRNFIVLLPAFSITIGIVAERFLTRKVLMASVFMSLLGVTNFWPLIARGLTIERLPKQNPKAASEYIVNKLKTGKYSLYYLDGGENDQRSRVHRGMARFYLDRLGMDSEGSFIPISLNDISTMDEPFLFLVHHSGKSVKEVAAEVSKTRSTGGYYEPPQWGGASAGVIIQDSSKPAR